MQWHPLLAELLRPVVQDYYEVQTNVPVGDVPREADLVLLRRKTEGSLPFHGIWTQLTRWNILEFKSPLVTPQVRDLDLLLELGLGIDRRLNEQRAKQGLRLIEADQVSFWYLANRLPARFLNRCSGRLKNLEPAGPGVWRSNVFERPFFLVSNVDLPVDAESLPLHLVSKGQYETELAVARLVIDQPELRNTFGQWVMTLHKKAWKEVRTMSRVADDEVPLDLELVVDYLGVEGIVKQFGLKRGIDEVGLKRVIDEVGVKRVIDEIGLEPLLESLTPAQRRELKRRLR